jgi:hypothetical protein
MRVLTEVIDLPKSFNSVFGIGPGVYVLHFGRALFMIKLLHDIPLGLLVFPRIHRRSRL